MVRVASILLALLILSFPAFPQGTSVGTAVAISPTGSASGTITDQFTSQYWKVTTTANGYLRIQSSSSTTVDIDVYLYDTNGSSTLTSGTLTGTTEEIFYFLKPGTYYIQAYRGGGTTGSYTLTTTFATPSRPSDAEPNDGSAQALPLSPTGISTGHIGFYGSSSSDGSDYWKITTTQDGWLRVQVRSDSLDLRGDVAFDVDVYLYDINGSSVLMSDTRTATFSQVSAFVRPGTYYVQAYRGGGRAGSYEIKSDFFPPTKANDTEGNDTYQTASSATVNGTVSGHLGYFSNGSTDNQDYWKFTLPGNGKLVAQVTADSLDLSGLLFDVDVYLYDVNGSSVITSDTRYGTLSTCTAYLKGGTYYILPYRGAGNAGSYSLTINYTVPTRADDGSGNDSPSTAKVFSYNAASSGHLGYYGNGTTNTSDYWKLTAPSSDSIYIQITSDASVDVDFYVYESNGTSTITSNTSTGTYSQAGFKPVSGNVYYVNAYRGGGIAGSYSILATRSSQAVSVEDPASQALIPRELVLEQNYPNPFNPSTTIRFGLPEEQHVRLSVFSILGQELSVLMEGTKPASMYTVVWNGRDRKGMDVPSGLYIIRLQAGDKQIVKKAMLVR